MNNMSEDRLQNAKQITITVEDKSDGCYLYIEADGKLFGSYMGKTVVINDRRGKTGL